jgi:uncharacterized protein (DUF488 family)
MNAQQAPGPARRIFTIGHSTRTSEEFRKLLEENGIRRLADIRRFPASRRLPHFNSGPLATDLQSIGIEYCHYPDLGGRRPARAGSPHTGWRVDAFRGYADYMETAEFAAALADLERWADQAPTALMCAEALYYKCHRRLTSDALLRNGFEVLHITGPNRVEPHTLTSFVRVEDGSGRLVYDVGELPLGS